MRWTFPLRPAPRKSTRLARPALALEGLEARVVPTTTPYVVPAHVGVTTQTILTVGDSVNLKPDGVTPYRFVGIPDGLGAYDNGNGTFTVVMNHEIPVNVTGSVAVPSGTARAHGNAGAFVSRWTIDKATLQVLQIEDLLGNATSLFLSNNNPGTGAVHTGYLPASTTVISRLCSADLAPLTAYSWTDPATGTFYGTTARIFQTGEESGGVATSVSGGGNIGPEGRVDFGRQWNMILTDDPNIPGDQSRTGYEMPHCGLFAWENNLANPLSQRKTIVMGMDDTTPGQVYVWVGDKQTSGNVVERAGLTRQSANDNLYVVRVNGLTPDATGATNEDRATPLSGTFSLENEGDVSGLTGAGLEALSDSKGGTQFLRPEDGHWDPNNPNDYYFVTTDRLDLAKDGLGTQVGRSRLYRLRFADIAHPEAGGSIECLLDGTEAGNMFDNMTVDRNGRILIQEDVGNQQHNGKIWMYDIATDDLILLAKHDPARFGDLGVPATAPFNQDEESSGIIDVSHILGSGTFLADVQAHYNPGDPELVEGGQLLLIRTNVVTAGLSSGVLTVNGSLEGDTISIIQQGQTLRVLANGQQVGQFDARQVDVIRADGGRGNDLIVVDRSVRDAAILTGGLGNDTIFGSASARSVIIGGAGSDLLVGGNDSDLVIGGNYVGTEADLATLLAVWAGPGSYEQRVAAAAALLAGKATGDGATDLLVGVWGLDLFVAGDEDIALAGSGEVVIRV